MACETISVSHSLSESLQNKFYFNPDERISSMQNGLNQIKYKPETLNFFSIYNISKTESIVFKNKDSGVVAETTILNAGFYSDIETFLRIIFPASLFEISMDNKDKDNKDIFRGNFNLKVNFENNLECTIPRFLALILNFIDVKDVFKSGTFRHFITKTFTARTSYQFNCDLNFNIRTIHLSSQLFNSSTSMMCAMILTDKVVQ